MPAYLPFLLALSLLGTDAVQAVGTPPNNVLRLDGDGDYVHLPSDLFNDLEQATVEAWVYWGDLGYFTQWFGFGGGLDFQAMGLNHEAYSTTLQFQ